MKRYNTCMIMMTCLVLSMAAACKTEPAEQGPKEINYDIERIHEKSDYNSKTVKICVGHTNIVYYDGHFFAEHFSVENERDVTYIGDNINPDDICK